MRILALAALTALVGCGGAPEPTPPPADARVDHATDLARFAFRDGQWDQASRLYATALARAEERDDLPAIATLSQELAITRLRAGDAAGTRDLVLRAEGELARRGRPVSPEMTLTGAFALWLLGEDNAASGRAGDVIADPATGEATRARARYLLGRLAADRRDAIALATIVGAMAPGGAPDLAADRAELEGRLALLRGDANEAEARLIAASELRREAVNYRGMAEALAEAGAAALGAGRQATAADLYLRAGRSALRAGDKRPAGDWLSPAARLGDASLAAEARALMAEQ